MQYVVKVLVALSLSAPGAQAADVADRGNDIVIPSLTISTAGTSTDFRLDQRTFLRLERSDLYRLARRTNREREVRIAGFSPEMGAHLVEMALERRAETYDLVRDMGQLTSAEARQARLAQAARHSSDAVAYQTGLAVWQARPLEGRLAP